MSEDNRGGYSVRRLFSVVHGSFRLVVLMAPLQVLLQVMLVLESSAAEDAAKLRLDSAFQSTMLVQGLAPFVRLAAIVAVELPNDA